MIEGYSRIWHAVVFNFTPMRSILLYNDMFEFYKRYDRGEVEMNNSDSKNVKVYEQVIEEIKDMIINGKLKKGDKLPSERELVEQLNVSRTSLREALRAIQIIGLIDCRQGEGNFIKESFENTLFEPLSIMFMLQESSAREIVDLRRLLEIEMVSYAAERATDEELERIKEIVEALAQSEDEKACVKLDKELHYTISKASGNYLIQNILNSVSQLMDWFIEDARLKILIRKENKAKLVKQHENICKALVEHDPEAARQAMREHLDFINEYMIE